MRIYECHTLSQVLTSLGIPRTSYYRMRKQGTIHDEIVERDGERLWRVEVLEEGDTPMKNRNKIQDIFSHRRFMREWIAFMEDGIHRKPWSKTYKRSQVSYIERYFERYEVISGDGLPENARVLECLAWYSKKVIGNHNNKGLAFLPLLLPRLMILVQENNSLYIFLPIHK